MNNEQLLLQIFEDTIKTPHQNKKKNLFQCQFTKP